MNPFPSWMDVVSTDIDASMAFYHSVFGWRSESILIGHSDAYSLVYSNEEVVAGAEQIVVAKGPARWTVFVQTADADELARVVTERGGSVSFAPDAMANYGTVAMVDDPRGATLGLWQPNRLDPSATGPVIGRLSGARLVTADPESAATFLEACFGWTISARPSPKTIVLDTGGVPTSIVSGAAELGWLPVIGVPELATILESIRLHGGRVGAGHVEGEHVVTDPMGATFLLEQRSTHMPVGTHHNGDGPGLNK
jgi:uncharacterized protein